MFSDVNTLTDDILENDLENDEVELNAAALAQSEVIQNAEVIFRRLGINSTDFTDEDTLNAMRRISHYMGFRDDVSKYSYNQIYNSVGAECAYASDDTKSFEEKETLSIAQELELCQKALQDTIEAIVSANNTATADANSDELKTKLLASIKEHNNNFADEEFNSNAIATIRELLCEKDSPTVDEVFEKITTNFPEKSFTYYTDSEKYKQSIAQLLNIYASSMKKVYHYQKMHESTSESITFLFREETDELKHLAEENKKGNVSFVKQFIKTEDNEFFVKCSCGKYARATLINKLLIFGGDTSVNVTHFPIGIKCPHCGKIHIVSENDLAEGVVRFKVEYIDVLRSFIQSSIKNCHVGSFGKYKVSINKMANHFPKSMLTDKTESDIDIVTGSHKEVQESPFEVELHSDEEYRKAIENFYKQLNTFSKDTLMLRDNMFNIRCNEKIIYEFTEDSSDVEIPLEYEEETEKQLETLKRLSKSSKTATYGIMATFVASRVNLDYHKTKNRAIFSLLLSLQSNPVIRAYTQLGNIEEKYANLRDLGECLSFTSNALPLEYTTILENILRHYKVITSSIEDYSMETIWEDATQLKEGLAKEIAEHESAIEDLKSLLYEMEEALTYTKIVNVNSIQLHEIGVLLTDEEFCRFCDRVADRMIITNYAENVGFKSSKSMNKLEGVQDSNTFKQTCLSFISSNLNGYRIIKTGETFSKNKQAIFDKYYKAATDTSFLKLAASVDVYDALKKCDYAKALDVCHDGNIDASQLGPDCKKLVDSSWENIKDFYEKTKNLCSLDNSAFYFTLAGFLAEEIDNSEPYKFSTKQIPKRQGTESLKEYVERVQNAKSYETVESSKFFKEIYRDLITIMLVSNPCKLEIKSFVNTVFMVSTINLIIDTMNYANMCDLFDISTDAYNMYMNQVYESDLYFKDGKWFAALEYYNGNDEISATLQLESPVFDNTLRIDVKDTINLESSVESYLNGMLAKLEDVASSHQPLMLVPKKDTIDSENLLMEFDPVTIVSYVKEFLEVK